MHTPVATLLLCTLLASQEPPAQQSKPDGTPAERFRALVDEYKPGVANVTTDQERVRWIGKCFKRHSELAVRLVELAAANPDDPIAVDALIEAVWQVNTTPWPV